MVSKDESEVRCRGVFAKVVVQARSSRGASQRRVFLTLALPASCCYQVPSCFLYSCFKHAIMTTRLRGRPARMLLKPFRLCTVD